MSWGVCTTTEFRDENYKMGNKLSLGGGELTQGGRELVEGNSEKRVSPK